MRVQITTKRTDELTTISVVALRTKETLHTITCTHEHTEKALIAAVNFCVNRGHRIAMSIDEVLRCAA